MKPTLLVFTSTFPRWINDTDPPFVYELARRLTDNFNVHVLTPHYTGAKRKEIFDGVTVHRYRYFFEKYERLAGSIGILPTLKTNRFYYLILPFFLMFGFWALLNLLFRLKPDVVHSHWMIPQGFFSAIFAKIYPTPFIVTVHGADLFALNSRLLRLMKSYTIKCATKVTIVSTAMLIKAKEDFPSANNLTVIPMGIDSLAFNTKTDFGRNSSFSPVKILFVGRLTEKKGVRYLIEAASSLIKRKIDFKITIVGDGELRRDLQDLTEKLTHGNFIQFLGAKINDELPEIYAAHDIFVGPSVRTPGGDTEGLGLTFVEAGMAGCVLVGTDVGGIGDVIRDGTTGFLIPEKNSEAIAGTIAHIIDNKQKMQGLTAQCRKECIEKFDLKKISEKYCKLLQHTVDTKHS